MRFSTAQPPLHEARDTVDLIAGSEAMGFAGAWVADQTFHADPWVVLSGAAAATNGIRLGLGLTNPHTRHPTTTARAAATMASISDGRFDLGLGAGNNRELLGPTGLLGPKPSKALAEALHIIRSLLRNGECDYEGEFFTCRAIRLETATGEVPILIGGRGERILHLAGRHADGVILSVAALGDTWEIVADAATKAGREPSRIRRVAWGECILEPSAEEWERQRHTLAHVLGRGPLPGLLVLGLEPELIAALKRAYEEDGIPSAAQYVSDDMIRRHMVIGSLDDCLEKLKDFEGRGVEEFAVLTKSKTSEERRQQFEQLAQKILPEFA